MSVRTAPRMPQRSPELAEDTEGHFFEYHGIWAPGVRAFRQLRFNTKALIISLAFMLPMLAIVGWLLVDEYQNSMQERMDATRQHVEVAYGMLQYAHEEERAGRLNREEAQALAKRLIEPLRYNEDEYFWINDTQRRMVMHPMSPELNGRDLSAFTDPNGFAMFAAFADTGRDGGRGFVHYQWPRPGETQGPAVDKVSYVAGFAPWGWVLGSGVYVEDVWASLQTAVLWTCLGVLGTLLLAGYLFYCFYRVIDGGLQETRRHLRAMSSGDLTTTPVPWGRDEAAQLMLEMQAMQNSLRTMVVKVRLASDEIVHSSKEIASGARDLSHRTEVMAANLQESAASMEEISATVSTSAHNTAQAAEMAQHNAEVAADGGRVMAEVVTTMEGIRSGSTRIAEITATIDSIAFQTNILALNAAVEAARAGEQGRGFAVVAAEVRTLAQRSAAAAREIKDLIDDSVQRVAQGATVVRKAGDTIADIVQSSQRVDSLLGEVANAAREQDVGVRQIGQAVNELDRVTQQNAALVEETAAAASAMEDQAADLAEEVARFRLPSGLTSSPVVRSLQAEAGVDLEQFNFDQAIDAHRQWKVKLRQAIAHRDTLDAETIGRDDCCQLGQWLHGAGERRFGRQALFGDLVDSHAEFHRAAGNVAKTINRGDYRQAESLIESGTPFAQASSDVTTLLSQAKRQFA